MVAKALMKDSIEINNSTRYKIPRIAFHDIKDHILGKKYHLTLNIIDSIEMKKLNKIYRNKNTSTDILSFPLDLSSGEIYLSFEDCESMRHDFDRDFDNFIAFLFIHGCTHLKGYDHGGIMESIEAKAREKFDI